MIYCFDAAGAVFVVFVISTSDETFVFAISIVIAYYLISHTSEIIGLILWPSCDPLSSRNDLVFLLTAYFTGGRREEGQTRRKEKVARVQKGGARACDRIPSRAQGVRKEAEKAGAREGAGHEG